MSSIDENDRYPVRGKRDRSQNSSSSFHESNTSGEIQSKSGFLKKKMWNNSWKEVFVQVEMGVLFEFKHRKSHKPSRVLTLSHFGIRLAKDLVGIDYSFGLFAKRKDPIFYSCRDRAELISWVTVCGNFCSDVDVEWKEDDMLEAFNDAVVMASEEGCIVGVNGIFFFFFFFFFLSLFPLFPFFSFYLFTPPILILFFFIFFFFFFFKALR